MSPLLSEVVNADPQAGPSSTPSGPRPLVIVVGADKGGTGKTTVARVLDDYLQHSNVVRKVFDGEFPAGDLRRFVPTASVVNLQSVDDQMQVFDTVDGVTIVDVKAGLLSPTLKSLSEVGLLDDVRSGQLNLALLHVLGQSVASLSEVRSMSDALGAGSYYFPVKNLVQEFGFQEWDKDARFSDQLGQLGPVTATIPHLQDRAAIEVQSAGLSFHGFAGNTKYSRMLRGYVAHWLGAVYQQFDAVGLGKLIKGAV